jgi:hypothetical protein
MLPKFSYFLFLAVAVLGEAYSYVQGIKQMLPDDMKFLSLLCIVTDGQFQDKFRLVIKVINSLSDFNPHQ